jgi:hypothetical protein
VRPHLPGDRGSCCSSGDDCCCTRTLNIHYHAVVPDGVFVGEDAARIEKLRPPTREEKVALLARIVKLSLALLARRGLLEADGEFDALGAMQAEAAQAGLGPWAAPEEAKKKLAAFVEVRKQGPQRRSRLGIND